MEKVSIIIPVYNRKELLARTLSSVAKQTWRPLEVIIVDNGSDDGTYEYALEWRDANSVEGLHVEVMREERRGACYARNTGLCAATGRFTLFFDSDDTMRPTLVERAVNGFRDHPEAEIVCWKCLIHTLDGKSKVAPFYPDRGMECHLVHALLRTHGYMAPTELFRKAGGWNEILPCWNDWELGVRMLLAVGVSGRERRGKIAGVPEILADIYPQKDSITGDSFSRKVGLWERSLEAVRQTISASRSENKRGMLQTVAYRGMILAACYKKESRPDLAADLLNGMSDDRSLSLMAKIVMRLLYHYTASGGRGAWRIARLFLAPSD